MAGRRVRSELSDRERMFVREYLIDMNASQAGIRAGYSRNSIGRNIHRVLNRPRVKAALAATMAERERELDISGARVLREIALLGFANLLDYVTPNEDGTADVDLSRLTRDRAAAIAEVTIAEAARPCGIPACGAGGRGAKRVRLKLADKSRNLELLGRHLGLFAARRDRSVEAGGGGNVQLSDMELAQRVLGILARARRGT